jgi:protein involved in polysaccharide export with SLBB domain
MVRVLGEVNEPGSYEFTENADYFSYILKAGGTTSLADIDRVYIIKGPAFKRETLQVGIGDLNKLGSPSPHDTILLMRDRTSLTERRISMAASIASIISTLLIFKVIF